MTTATTSASTATSGVFEAASHLRTTATRAFQQLVGDIEAGLEELQGALQAEARQHPVRSMLVAAGVGYVLGGGIARPLTRQFARVALRALLAPALDEPGARLWEWIEPHPSNPRSSRRRGAGKSSTSGATAPGTEGEKGETHHGN